MILANNAVSHFHSLSCRSGSPTPVQK